MSDFVNGLKEVLDQRHVRVINEKPVLTRLNECRLSICLSTECGLEEMLERAAQFVRCLSSKGISEVYIDGPTKHAPWDATLYMRLWFATVTPELVMSALSEIAKS